VNEIPIGWPVKYLIFCCQGIAITPSVYPITLEKMGACMIYRVENKLQLKFL
jgi:hypothetical protein